MSVYLLTVHAYRSWPEDHRKGYVQRGRGLQPTDPQRAKWRSDHASHPPARITRAQQVVAHEAVRAWFTDIDLYACATVPTHIPMLVAFRSPACECPRKGAAPHCNQRCPARQHLAQSAAKLKPHLGLQLAKAAGTKGRQWLSRGWDITPVRDREHLAHLLDEYLPDHERKQHGIYRRYH